MDHRDSKQDGGDDLDRMGKIHLRAQLILEEADYTPGMA